MSTKALTRLRVFACRVGLAQLRNLASLVCCEHSVCCTLKKHHGFIRLENLHTNESAVYQNGQLTRNSVRVRDIESRGNRL